MITSMLMFNWHGISIMHCHSGGVFHCAGSISIVCIVEGGRCMRGSDGKLCFSEKEKR